MSETKKEVFQIGVDFHFKKEPNTILVSNEDPKKAVEELRIEVTNTYLFLESELQIAKKVFDDLQLLSEKLENGEDFNKFITEK